jgi:excisionase family DNA binding protein
VSALENVTETTESACDGVVTLSEPLLTAADVSALLGVPRSSVYEYARRQRDPLPSLLIGRHRRFYRSEIERWLAGQRGHNFVTRSL